MQSQKREGKAVESSGLFALITNAHKSTDTYKHTQTHKDTDTHTRTPSPPLSLHLLFLSGKSFARIEDLTVKNAESRVLVRGRVHTVRAIVGDPSLEKRMPGYLHLWRI